MENLYARGLRAAITFLEKRGFEVVDKVVSIAAGKTIFINIESGRFKNVSGENKGKVILAGESADIKVAVVKLPQLIIKKRNGYETLRFYGQVA